MKTIIVDLDGTLFNIDHRLHHLERKDYDAFWAAIPHDLPNEWCVRLAEAMMRVGNEVIFISGRNSVARKETEAWLEKLGFGECKLYMRAKGDYREDHIVKSEIIDSHLRRKEVLFVIEDRKQVVDMYRSRGYTVLQCAEGNF